MRNRTTPSGRHEGSRRFQPGDLVREYADRMGWPLAIHNIMVEGTTDVGYFELASGLYQSETGLSLIGDDLSVFPVGEGRDGGTTQIQGKLQVLRGVLQTDPVDEEGQEFKVICLVDRDYAGKRLLRVLTSREVGFMENRDVFLLHRKYPMATRDPRQFTRQLKELNADDSHLDCETEDLLSRDILETFCGDNPGCLRRDVDIAGGCYHYEFMDHTYKGKLLRFAQEIAVLEDVHGICDVLRSMRYAIGLPADGHAQ